MCMCVCVFVCVSYQVLDAAKYCCGQYACEKGHEVQSSEGPDQNVQSENFLTAAHSNKLVVVAEIASAGEQNNSFDLLDKNWRMTGRNNKSL